MMRERAALLGGTFQIESVVEEGTTVTIEIPLQEKEDK
jgi:signal transduction histidine kinase